MPNKTSKTFPDALRNFDELPTAALVAQPTVEALFGISAATVWRRVHSGDLPQPRRYGARSTRWKVGELREILNRQRAA